MHRNLKKGCLIFGATLILALIGLEVGLRVSGHRQRSFEDSVNVLHRRWVALLTAGIYEEVDDSVRRYAMRPGANVQVDDWTFRVNSHRARGEEFPREKPAGEKRLLCLGDSFAFGLWCDEDQTLVAHVARMANQAEAARGSATSWRPVNLGVPGYHSGQQLRAFEQDGLELEPDVVLLYFNTNDITNEGFFLDETLPALRSDHFPLPANLRRALWSSHLYGFLTSRYTRSFNRRAAPHIDPEVPWSHNRPSNQAATRDALLAIAAICRERDIPLFFVHQPLMVWQGAARQPHWPILELVDWTREVHKSMDVPGVELLGWMRGYADGVDRTGTDPPQASPTIPDRYFADEVVEEYWRRIGAGESTEDLTLPEEPDFHLIGAGYESMANVVYAAMRDAEVLP